MPLPDIAPLLGGLAALAASLCFALSATAWGLVAGRMPTLGLIAVRTTLAALLFAALIWASTGAPWPATLAGEAGLLLALSGLVSMGLGDYMFFKGLVRIGPRLSMVVFASTPIMAALIAWLATGEALGLRAITGIAVIVAGIAWVVSEPRGRGGWSDDAREFRKGVLLSLGSCVTVSIAFVLTRAALAGGAPLFGDGPPRPPADAVEASLVRLATTAALVWLALPFTVSLRPTLAALADRRLMRIIVPGTVAGLIVGMWLSMVALARLPSGVAAALMGCTPIFMVPLAHVAFGERHSVRALAGTLVTVAGVFILLF